MSNGKIIIFRRVIFYESQPKCQLAHVRTK